MRSSVACLPSGTLLSLALTPDASTLRAAVVYGRPVALQDGAVVLWLHWFIRRLATRDDQPVWAAMAQALPEAGGSALPLRVLDGRDTFTAHQFKGLATALGIWTSLRRAPMLERAALFNRQALTGHIDARLDELLERDSHFGLPARAAAMDWNVGP